VVGLISLLLLYSPSGDCVNIGLTLINIRPVYYLIGISNPDILE